MKKIEGTIEAWENGDLGCDEEFARVTNDSEEIDKALGLQMISIRLDISLIDDLKAIADLQGIGYQPLIRTVLHRFTNAEMKRIARDYAAQQAAKKAQVDDEPPRDCA